MHSYRSLVVLCGVLCQAWGDGRPVSAQAPGIPIESNLPPQRIDDYRKQAHALRNSGRLLGAPQVVEQMAQPAGKAFELPLPRTQPLTGREVADRARRATVRVGWYARHEGARRWSLVLAGGYAVTADGLVATCRHCIEPLPDMAEGGLVAVDARGRLHAVKQIVAADETLDACLVQLDASGFEPLPLNDQIAPGDAAYCLSDPFGQNGYFSAGIVNRFYWLDRPPNDPTSWNALRELRLNVSTDWALGSSGAAVLDDRGNAIGHVARIQALTLDGSEEGSAQPRERKRKPAGGSSETVLVLHEAVPARGVMELARRARTPQEAAPLSALEALLSRN
jgi:hypothetical protein